MKYQYFKNGNLLFESDSKIKFNEKLFPAFAEIEPTIVKKKSYSYSSKETEEANEEAE